MVVAVAVVLGCERGVSVSFFRVPASSRSLAVFLISLLLTLLQLTGFGSCSSLPNTSPLSCASIPLSYSPPPLFFFYFFLSLFSYLTKCQFISLSFAFSRQEDLVEDEREWEREAGRIIETTCEGIWQ